MDLHTPIHNLHTLAGRDKGIAHNENTHVHKEVVKGVRSTISLLLPCGLSCVSSDCLYSLEPHKVIK